MKRANVNQLGLFEEPEVVVGAPARPEVVSADSGPSKVSPAGAPSRAPVFTDGVNCSVPTWFPTVGGRPNISKRIGVAIEDKDWVGLRNLRSRWFCWACRHWHEFSARFFSEFRGLYPHQYREQRAPVSQAETRNYLELGQR